MFERLKRWRHGRATALASVALTALVLLAGCQGQALDEVEPVDGASQVAVEDNSFSPRVIRVSSGTEVTWDWGGASREHNVSGDGFQSDVQEDGSFAHRFETPGVYDYRCTLHGGMTARVIVADDAFGRAGGTR